MISFLLAAALANRPDVAVVISDDLAPYLDPVAGFTDAIGVPVQIINFHGRYANVELEIQALKISEPEVVFALGAKAAWAIRTMMPNTPMVYANVLDPKRYGVPGDQVTGIRAVVPSVTYLSQVVAFFPNLKTVGVIRSTAFLDSEEKDLVRAGREVGLTITVKRVENPRGFRKVFNALAEEMDAVWVSPVRGILTPEGFRTAAEEMRRRRKPLLADTENMVTAGAAFSVTPSPEGVGRQAAEMASKILDGAAPAILSVADPKTLSTALNLRTLKAGEISYEPLMVDFAEVVIE